MTIDEIRKLSNAATPGEWDQDTGGDITRSDGTTLFTREQPGIGLNESFANTDFAIAAVNYVRALLAAAPVVAGKFCTRCGCKLSTNFGGLEEHKANCAELPL